MAKIFKEDYEDENLIMIVHFIETSYSQALEKFFVVEIFIFLMFFSFSRYHNSVMLKIQYALFIFEQLGLKQQALQELFLLENSRLTLEQEFIIFRLKFCYLIIIHFYFF